MTRHKQCKQTSKHTKQTAHTLHIKHTLNTYLNNNNTHRGDVERKDRRKCLILVSITQITAQSFFSPIFSPSSSRSLFASKISCLRHKNSFARGGPSRCCVYQLSLGREPRAAAFTPRDVRSNMRSHGHPGSGAAADGVVTRTLSPSVEWIQLVTCISMVSPLPFFPQQIFWRHCLVISGTTLFSSF